MATSDTRQVERLPEVDAGLTQFRSQRVKVGAFEGGMGFRGRTKVDLNPEMKLYQHPACLANSTGLGISIMPNIPA